jgi:hypothetical protein
VVDPAAILATETGYDLSQVLDLGCEGDGAGDLGETGTLLDCFDA